MIPASQLHDYLHSATRGAASREPTGFFPLPNLLPFALFFSCELHDRLDGVPIQVVFRQEPSSRIMEFAEIVFKVLPLCESATNGSGIRIRLRLRLHHLRHSMEGADEQTDSRRSDQRTRLESLLSGLSSPTCAASASLELPATACGLFTYPDPAS